MFALVGVAATPAAAAAGAAATTSTWSDFAEWKRQHGRTYATTAEAAVRFDAWASNEHSLEAARDANPHARFEADWTADWTSDELAGLRGGPLNTTGAEEQQPFDDAAVGDAMNPNRSPSPSPSPSPNPNPNLKQVGDAGPIDWVKLGAVNAPVSQGRCGTCAQFSATADIEAQWFLHGHANPKPNPNPNPHPHPHPNQVPPRPRPPQALGAGDDRLRLVHGAVWYGLGLRRAQGPGLEPDLPAGQPLGPDAQGLPLAVQHECS
eukprot:scaffold11694_cov63-Phaeocystis_antarctica.AAC.2